MDNEVMETAETIDETPVETVESTTDIAPYSDEVTDSSLPAIALGATIATVAIVGAPKLFKAAKNLATKGKDKLTKAIADRKEKKSKDSVDSEDHVVIDEVKDEKTE